MQLADARSTERVGRWLAAAAKKGIAAHEPVGACIHLRGDLGAGKTTLTRGLLRGFGVTGAVKSPTYTLVEPYELAELAVYHFDLYRLSDPREIAYLGIESYFRPDALCVIEWPEHGGNAIPSADLDLELRTTARGRELQWRALTPRGAALAERLLG